VPSHAAVYAIRRVDTLAVMHFTVTFDPDADDGIFVFDLFSDGDATTGDGDSATSVDGGRLLDSDRRKVYLAASDGKGKCLCSRALRGDLEPGQTYTFYSTYAAAPAEVGALEFRSRTSARSLVGRSSSRRAVAAGLAN
jgi:hypothetical protein